MRDQPRILLRTVNRRWLAAGLERLPREALLRRRLLVRPFENPGGGEIAATDRKSGGVLWANDWVQEPNSRDGKGRG